MKVNSIQGVSLSYFATKKQNNSNYANHNSNITLPIADNYGRAMVNFKSGKGRNIKDLVVKAPLEDKLAVVLASIQSDTLFIVSNNFKRALKM